MYHLLATVICETFSNEAWGSNKVMLVEFKTLVDHRKETGYRYLDLLLHSPMRYVKVWTRQRWVVAPMPEDGQEELHYDEGSTEWRLHVDHDSVWRSKVGDIIYQYKSDLLTFAGIRSWYKIADFDPSVHPVKNTRY